MYPFSSGEINPMQLALKIGQGLQMLRLWRKYVEESSLRLHSAPNAIKEPNKRGHFITRQIYMSLEIQCHTAIQYLLAVYL